MNWIVRLLLLCCIFLSPVASSAKTHVLLTVDVESYTAGNPKTNILGVIEGFKGEHGVPRILDILDANKSKATFYLNVYEIARHGEGVLKRIAQQIVSREQDIQLHTHPEAMYGKFAMSLFDQNMQEEILTKGKDLIFQWTGKNTIAHRAGAYAGNSDTLKALKKTGFRVDSSLSPALLSPLSKEGYTANDITVIEGILEIPVTYYSQLKFLGWSSTRLLDIESSSLRELKDVLNQMADRGSCTANIMMHSFSITRYGYPDERVVDKLNALLQFINNHPQLESITTTDFFELYKSHKLSCIPATDFVPHTGVVNTYLRSWERFFDGWKNIAVALGIPVGILALVFLLRRMIWFPLAREKKH